MDVCRRASQPGTPGNIRQAPFFFNNVNMEKACLIRRLNSEYNVLFGLEISFVALAAGVQ